MPRTERDPTQAVAGRSIAIVPFAARSDDRSVGAWGRQLAHRLVDRFSGHPALELRPVFLVTMPEAATDAAHLVLGSAPDPSLAARYGAALGTTHALAGSLIVDQQGRRIEVTLVEVAAPRTVDTFARVYPAGTLHQAEPDLAGWLAGALETTPPTGGPAAESEPAYTALLEGLDEELNAALLRPQDPERAGAALDRALSRHLTAIAADPGCAAAEERILVLAAESLERGEEARLIGPLEALTETVPHSWRAHYLLAELRQQHGDAAGAIVALEHADALRPLGDADALRLALLYRDQAAPRVAAARLRRIPVGSPVHAAAAVARLDLARALVAAGDRAGSVAELVALVGAERTGEVAAQARRLLLGLRAPGLERRLEAAGNAAIGGADDQLASAAAELAAISATEPDLWEAHFGAGLVARRTGDAAAAERAFRRALALWPDQPDALHELGVVLLMADRTDEAVSALERAARLRPDDAGYLADAGFGRLRAGDLGAARERLAAARALGPDDPVTEAYWAELERIGGV